jgi:hypothetical protein
MNTFIKYNYCHKWNDKGYVKDDVDYYGELQGRLQQQLGQEVIFYHIAYLNSIRMRVEKEIKGRIYATERAVFCDSDALNRSIQICQFLSDTINEFAKIEKETSC